MITVKSTHELTIMRRAGQIVAEVHAGLAERIRPGVSTAELDAFAEAHIRAAGATPTFKGYNGFPATLCISVNEEVIHGIPGKYRLKEGGHRLGGLWRDLAELRRGLGVELRRRAYHGRPGGPAEGDRGVVVGGDRGRAYRQPPL